MDYRKHHLYNRAMAHANNLLKDPEVLRAKLEEKSNWVQEGLPSAEELAVLIIDWCERQDEQLKTKI